MEICVSLVLVFAATIYGGPQDDTDDCIEKQTHLLTGTAYFSAIVPGGDVRGFVQVCEGSRWKYICDDNWTLADATVACRQLGHDAAASNGTVSQSVPYGLSYIPQCSGTEQNLLSCMNTPTSGKCDIQVAVSCWNRSSDTITTTTITTTITSTLVLSTTTSSSYALSLHHDVQPTPTSMKTAVLPLTPQPPAETSSTGSPVASTTCPGTQTATETAGLEPVVGALTGVAVVMTLSTAVLAVCMMWRLAKSRRRHIPSAGVEMKELGTNPAYQTTASLISSSPNEAYAGITVNTLYEDIM